MINETHLLAALNIQYTSPQFPKCPFIFEGSLLGIHVQPTGVPGPIFFRIASPYFRVPTYISTAISNISE
jgi:hypothetical protein